MTLQMGTNQPRRTAERTLRQPPGPVSYWLIAEKQDKRIEVLTLHTDGTQETLPVFSSDSYSLCPIHHSPHRLIVPIATARIGGSGDPLGALHRSSCGWDSLCFSPSAAAPPLCGAAARSS